MWLGFLCVRLWPLCGGIVCLLVWGGACTIWFVCEVECVPDVVLGGGGDRFGVGC